MTPALDLGSGMTEPCARGLWAGSGGAEPECVDLEQQQPMLVYDSGRGVFSWDESCDGGNVIHRDYIFPDLDVVVDGR